MKTLQQIQMFPDLPANAPPGKPVKKDQRMPFDPVASRKAIKESRRPAWVQVTPGRWIAGNPNLPPPDYVLSKVTKLPDGTVKLDPLPHTWVRLNKALLRQLGMPNGYNTMRRLALAGFIEIGRPTGSITMLNLDSWFNHLDRTINDPDYWDRDGEAFKIYQENYA